MRQRGRPPRDEAALGLRRLVACMVKAHMDTGMTLEDAAQRVADLAARGALDMVSEWRTGTALAVDGFSPDQIRRILDIAPVGPSVWLRRISASTAKKAYTEHFGDGSRTKPTGTGRRNKLT